MQCTKHNKIYITTTGGRPARDNKCSKDNARIESIENRISAANWAQRRLVRDREAQKNRVFINKRRYAINCDAAKARFMDGVFFCGLAHSLSLSLTLLWWFGCATFTCRTNTIATQTATASMCMPISIHAAHTFAYLFRSPAYFSV